MVGIGGEWWVGMVEMVGNGNGGNGKLVGMVGNGNGGNGELVGKCWVEMLGNGGHGEWWMVRWVDVRWWVRVGYSGGNAGLRGRWQVVVGMGSGVGGR